MRFYNNSFCRRKCNGIHEIQCYVHTMKLVEFLGLFLSTPNVKLFRKNGMELSQNKKNKTIRLIAQQIQLGDLPAQEVWGVYRKWNKRNNEIKFYLIVVHLHRQLLSCLTYSFIAVTSWCCCFSKFAKVSTAVQGNCILCCSRLYCVSNESGILIKSVFIMK